MNSLLDKPIKEEGVTVHRDGPKVKDVEELDKRRAVRPVGYFFFSIMT